MKCPLCVLELTGTPVTPGVVIHGCSQCFGSFCPGDEILVPIKLESPSFSPWPCPSCQEPMNRGTLFQERLTLDKCANCSGVWFDSFEIDKLRKLTGTEGVLGPAGSAPEPAPGEPAPAVGPTIREPLPPAASMAAFSAQMAPRLEKGFRHGEAEEKEDETRAKNGQSREIVAPDSLAQDHKDEREDPAYLHQDRKYGHFQTSLPVVTYVLGEFNWRVKVGEHARSRDFIAPTFLLSEEISGKDSVWTHGEYLEPEEVAQAFALTGPLPAREGTAPHQPNPWSENWTGMLLTFGAAAMVCLALQVGLSGMALDKTVLDQTFRYDAAQPEKSKVTELFELGGHTSNVKVYSMANLSNQWAYLSMALINADTDEALDFGRELSAYHGVAEGEVWNEGKNSDTIYLPSVKPGRYYLRVEPETDASGGAGFDYRVKLTRDAPRMIYLPLAWLLLALPLLLVWWRRRAFESSRWKDSDHPMESLLNLEAEDSPAGVFLILLLFGFMIWLMAAVG